MSNNFRLIKNKNEFVNNYTLSLKSNHVEEKSNDSCGLYHFQSMFDYLDNTVIKLCDMSTVGTDLGTVKQQIEELKVSKTFVLLHFCGPSE